MSIFAKIIKLGVLLVVARAAAQTTQAVPDRVVSRLRIGPFFEYRATRAGGTFWAVRPFYANVRDPLSATRVTDVVWPLTTFHRDQDRTWWRLLLAYGSNDDVTRNDAAWKRFVLPLWFQGRTRSGEPYRALFPIHGHVPHLLLMEDIDFTLFPFYFNYEVNGVERVYTPWPLYSRVSENPVLRETGVFPFWCRQTNTKKETERLYAFWPFWTSAVYGGDRNPGVSRLLFPLYGDVRRARECQRLVLPPFFSYAKTDAVKRWRLPWPFYETLETFGTRTAKPAHKRSYWPFYGSASDDATTRRYALWPLYWQSRVSGKDYRMERTRFFPFYVNESRQVYDQEGSVRELERYTRIWPLYERVRTPERTHARVLGLSLIRHSGAIERNWAPFWTVYERIATRDEVAHDALWGLFSMRRAVRGQDAARETHNARRSTHNAQGMGKEEAL